MYDLYKAGGGGYWVPGHGRYSADWNVKIVVQGGVAPDEAIVIFGGSEGPDARIIGMHGNRKIILDYDPNPLVGSMNQRVDQVPSLYTNQRAKRIEE